MDADSVIDTAVVLLTEVGVAVKYEGFGASTNTPGFQKGARRFLGKERLRKNPEVPLCGIHTSGRADQLRRSGSTVGSYQECAICQPPGISSRVEAA